VLDVLMMADLRRAPQPILERYMGPGGRRRIPQPLNSLPGHIISPPLIFFSIFCNVSGFQITF
jgi:hypothetical protein